MKIFVVITLFFVALNSSFASSELVEQKSNLPQATALVTKKTEIKFYKDQNGDSVDVVLQSKSLKFPISVLEENGEYIKILINEKLLWARSTNFKLNRSCSQLAATSTADMNSKELSASRGVGGGKGCSK